MTQQGNVALTRIKICCIQDRHEAEMAAEAGAHALGLVSSMPSGPGVISDDEIKSIITGIKPFTIPVLLTSKNDPAEIRAQALYCKPGAIQLCEPLTESALQTLRKLLPGTALIRVIHVSGKESVTEAHQFSSLVDAFLLDTGQRSGPQKQLGGTGKTHDWNLSSEIVRTANRPVILAGGLNPENVQAAIKAVRPYAVDVCSGVRSENKLDAKKLHDFIHAVQNAA